MASSIKKSSPWLFIGGLLLLFVLSILHLYQGQADYTIRTLMTEVWYEGNVQNIVLGLRLPRVIIGILSGGALAVAGVLLQTLTKNPLASPSTLGINSGAYLLTVIAMVFFPQYIGDYPFVISFLGAGLSAVLLIALVGRVMEPVRVALTGMIVALLFSSITGAVQLLFENETNGLFLWGSGTLIQLDWSGVKFSIFFILIGLIIALVLGKSLDLLSLGDDLATSLGQSVNRVKAFAWFTAILLSAVTVSVVGPIGFIGLMAPHLVRLMGIQGHKLLILHSFLWGANLLVAADVLAMWIQPGQEIPVGAMTALIGAPWLMYLAYKTGKRQTRGESRLGSSLLPISYRWILFGLFGLTIMIILVSVSYGAGSFFTFQDWLDKSFNSPFVMQFRIPRILTAFLVGMLLATSGLFIQAVLRNPLADPSVLGITSGGGAGALIFLVLFPAVSIQFLPIAAMIGSSISITIILILSWKTQWQPILLALMGVAVSAFGSAIIQILIVKANIGVAPALAWLAGSTYAKGWEELKLAGIVALITIPLSILFIKKFDVISFGDEVAEGLGVNIIMTRLLAIMLGVCMGAVSVSIVGTVGFIGLLAPHAARRMVGFEHGKVIPVSLFLGGILLTSADLIGRIVLAPKEIPSGLVVALIGTPYLLYLLRKI